MLNPNGNGEFELGFVVGYQSPICGGTPNNPLSSPALFNYRMNSNGAESCHTFTSVSPTPGDWEDLKVYHFSYGWSSFWEGTNLQLSGVPLTWGLGQGAVNMERGGVHDRGEAYFRFINEFHNEDGWTYTDDLRSPLTTIPG